MDLLLFGIQGSGKGTQAKRLAAEHGYHIFEAGGELRKIAASDTDLGHKVSSYIDHGHLVPFEIIMEVVRTSVAAQPLDEKLLFDGIPRDMDQKRAFDALMNDLGRDFRCVHLVVDEEEALKRVQQRAQEQGRADDANEEFIRRRMNLFHEKTEPVINDYRMQGKVIDVGGEGTMDEVYENIIAAL
ncbi:adenylate kinase [Candidatus Peribacteria bacterium]|nr:MAG: adenylate kinase [Candidatus Peribacteria bacterium]